MAAKKKTTKSKKKLDVKVRMIGELIDVTGSSKDSWNPAEISDDMKAISYIRKLADTWNQAQLNEALKYLGFKTVDTWNPAELEETKNKLVKYFLPTDASGNPIELDLKGSLPYEVTACSVDLLPIQDLSHGEPSPTNICPISGRTEVNLTVADAETSPTQTETYTETLGQTVYGGKVDFVNGTATITHGVYTFTGEETWVQQPGYNKYYSYDNILRGLALLPEDNHQSVPIVTSIGSFNIPYFGLESHSYSMCIASDGRIGITGDLKNESGTLRGVQICYGLATPTELTTSAEQISLLKGNNVLSTDGDNINITYKAILNS